MFFVAKTKNTRMTKRAHEVAKIEGDNIELGDKIQDKISTTQHENNMNKELCLHFCYILKYKLVLSGD